MEKVQIDMDHCAGVTDFAGRHYTADKHGEVTIPSDTAQALRIDKIVRNPRRVFGGFELPKRPATTN